MKNTVLCIAAAIAILFSLAACSAVPDYTGDETENNQIPNPWIDCDTEETAAKLAGFSFTAPDTVAGFGNRTIQAVEGEIIQYFYTDEADSEQAESAVLRKGKGSEDISGDYNDYAETQSVEVNGQTVNVKGNNGKAQLAVWTDGDYTYSVSVPGFSTLEEMTALIEALC